MKKESLTALLGKVVISGILAAMLAVAVDCCTVLWESGLSSIGFLVLFGILFLGAFFIPKKLRFALVVLLPVAVALCIGIGTLCWKPVSRTAGYADVDNGKQKLYGDKRVMLLVPHQDDDVILMGGVLEEYVKYGSDVYVVFTTNGDYHGLAQIRFQEALAAMESVGIPAEQVIFLGYGNEWEPSGPHIYNAEPGTVLTSVYGRTETYGTEAAQVWRDGISYTVDHYLEDLQCVILQYMPDTIYCIDYDHHIDHRALSLSFEKVMGKILKAQPDYRPAVYKGFAYSTAWEAEWDFFEENLGQTRNPFGESYGPSPKIYRWNDRVRLPVAAGALSRSLLASGVQKTLMAYASQKTLLHGMGVINGDKVFWQRETHSLCYDAQIQVSSSNAALLNDFMLMEDLDLLDENMLPEDGAWVPDIGDPEKRITVTFPENRNISRIVLYDHPSAEHNVLNAVISFDDGTMMETGPLDPDGAATEIAVEKTAASFEIQLSSWEGEPGLTEIEAFSSEKKSLPYIKLMDRDGNFVYDYWMKSDGSQTFFLYDGNGGICTGAEGHVVSGSNPDCPVIWNNGEITVECPVGEETIVTVSDCAGEMSDSVVISNPGKLTRAWRMLWMKAEESALRLIHDASAQEKMVAVRLWNRIRNLIG